MSSKDMIFHNGENLSKADERALCRDELIYNVTEDLLVILEDMNISKMELARRLGKTRSYVTQILSGSRNMTLGSLSDICFALGFKPEIRLPVEESEVNLSHEKHSGQVRLPSFSDIMEKYFESFHLESINKISLNEEYYAKQTIQSSNVIDRRDQMHWSKVA